jgi:hypothetical protein
MADFVRSQKRDIMILLPDLNHLTHCFVLLIGS